MYHDVDGEQLEKIKQDAATKNVVLTSEVGYAPLEDSQNDQKPYMFIEAFDEKGFTDFPIVLKDGHLPKSANEIIISEAIKDDANVPYKIGDTIDMELGDRVLLDEEGGEEPLPQTASLAFSYETNELMEELQIHSNEQYKVVGIMEQPSWEPVWSPGYTYVTYIDDHAIKMGMASMQRLHGIRSQNTNKKHAQELAEELGIGRVSYNDELLRYYGFINNNVRMSLILLSSIIMGIIVLGSVSLIYNAFAISVSERSRYLGMLSSVGATKKQKRNSVFFEGFVIGLLSIPIGVIAGITGIGITIMSINPILKEAQLGLTESLHVVISPAAIAIACAVSMLTIFMSLYIPARRASKVTAIDAIRQTLDIVKLTNKKVKTNRFVRKVFGFEAEIALKNLKRNKRKYVATVISLVVSIILFLSVTYFTNSIKTVNGMTAQNLNYDIEINQSSQSDEQWERLVDKITAMDTTDYNVIHMLWLSAWMEPSAIQDKVQDIYDNDDLIETNEDGQYQMGISVQSLSDEKLKKFAEEVGADYDALQSQDHLSGILINKERFDLDGKYYDIEPMGKMIDSMKLFDDMAEETYFVETVRPLAYTDKLPVGVTDSWFGQLNMIVSEKTYQSLLANVNDTDLVSESAIYIKSDDPIKTEEEIDKIREVALNMMNHYAFQQQDRQLILLMSVFIYGFITLITLISMANIFNTISTSIALRKREFAMLKSMGMTPKGFNKMINYESIFYGMKSLLYGLPISVIFMYLMHRAMAKGFSWKFELPWGTLLIVIVAIFIIVGSAMLYSSSKVKKENIIDALKQENH